MIRASRASRVVPPPNSRSNTSRGLISIGSGVVSFFQLSVFMYAQLKPGEQSPIRPVKSSVASSSDGSIVA